MAASKFTEGISIFQKHSEKVLNNADCLAKLTQLFTNRSLAWHSIGNQEDAFKDADYVIKNLEPKNTKALYRRSHCYKLKHQYTLAVSDLEIVCQIDPKNPVAKKDLIELKSKLHEEKQSKIKEVDSTPVKNVSADPSSPPKQSSKQ